MPEAFLEQSKEVDADGSDVSDGEPLENDEDDADSFFKDNVFEYCMNRADFKELAAEPSPLAQKFNNIATTSNLES